ncbi:hypothetical protein ICN18_02120 [Polynucleobacter sp. Ross1-W9]|uniref:hypothetical protein n=1 Tax=Polynucleobacter parvulilacunae TaxID=1855631 RepID=UPI001C0DDD4B|nr:hypothetical protein [Polynucleobacter parvulilacunae]MBU3556423.1 hypothetical protein [Polynucleobacter parvulilacunae]
MKMKRIAVYLVGLFTGAGIAVAVVSNAADSIIPFTFKDGQVISADTLNDLVASINSSAQGVSTESELNGSWTCSTYDPSSASAKTAGMPNSNFNTDPVTGLQKLVNTWTFSNGGKNLSMNLIPLGGITGSGNNTGGCTGVTNFTYAANVVESTLMLSSTTGCTGGNGYILPIIKASPYKFRVVVDKTVISCVAANQPPAIPTNLVATAGSGGVGISWTDNGGSPTGFSILKKVSGAYTEIGTTSDTSYTDASGAVGALYRVKSTNANGSSLASIAVLAN